jgi:alpha-N-arabinofuranosidase
MKQTHDAANVSVGQKLYMFPNGLFGVNAEVTRKGFFGGLSAQMLNNRKFFKGEKTPDGWECENAQLCFDKNESPCGSNYVRLTDGMIKQTSDVIAFKKGAEYAVKALVRSDGASVSFGVPGREKTFENVRGDGYKELSFLFLSDGEESSTFVLSVSGTADVYAVSFMPADNFYGMRRDVIAALKRIAPTAIRFPGGCCADHFDWKQCLKPADLRTPFDGSIKDFMLRDTYHQDCADISLNEFIMLCQKVGAEPEFTVSIVLSDGVDARRLDEYCNGGTDTEYGAKRAAMGFEEPFGVKYFYVGNEVYYFGYEYQNDGVKAAKRTNEIVNAMRTADDGITVCLGVVADTGLRGWSRDFVNTLDCRYDCVSYHRYCGSKPGSEAERKAVEDGIPGSFYGGVDEGLAFVHDELFAGVEMPVNVDEWNFSWGCDANNAMFLSNVLEFHFFARSYEKYGVTDARFFMPVSEGMITVNGAACTVECAGEAFRLLHGHTDGTVVECSAENRDLDVLCTDHGDHLFMSVVNRGGDEWQIAVDGYAVESCTQIVLDEYSFNNNGFEIKHYDKPVVTGHGMTFLCLTAVSE